MATVTVTHQVTDLNGANIGIVEVVVKLNQPARKANFTQVAKQKTFLTDVAGNVSMVLEKNADLIPPSTYYTAEVKVPSSAGSPDIFTFLATANQTLFASLIDVF